METFEEDFRYILLKQNLTDIIPLANSRIKTHESKNKGLSPTNDRALMYFKQLSKQQISKLHEMYFLDIKIFDYDVEMYGEIT